MFSFNRVAVKLGSGGPLHLIPVLRRQKQDYPCEFKASLVHNVSSRTARIVTQRNSVSKNQGMKKELL